MIKVNSIMLVFGLLLLPLFAFSRAFAQMEQEQPSNQANWRSSSFGNSAPPVQTGLPTPKYGSTSPPKSSRKNKMEQVDLDDVPPLAPMHHRTVTYPWKTNIITTIFWIGESGSSLSPTTNLASAWITDWCSSYGGDDDQGDRRGYLPRHHAAMGNPFYVALPFNDLAFPEKARQWLPPGWAHPVRAGQKQISACKDRWVEIRNSQGRSCFAQWEDVGPLRYDHAEYVFGDERPNTMTRAGLDVSPAVATYLGIDENNRLTAWRFVEAEDVPSGEWLKYEEQATLLLAMREASGPVMMSPLQPSTTSQPASQTPAVQQNSSNDASSAQRKKLRNNKG